MKLEIKILCVPLALLVGICSCQDDNCVIFPTINTFPAYFEKMVLNEFELRMLNYTNDPLRKIIGNNYKPWLWHRTQRQHGRTLLMLSFNYDVLSMTILTIGVEKLVIDLKDSPFGCFDQLNDDEKILKVRRLLLDGFKNEKKSTGDLQLEKQAERIVYVCNEVVNDKDGNADFVNSCCHQKVTGEIVCTEEVEDSWIALLYVCIFMVKVILFLFCPLLLPSEIYSAAYVASEYVVKLKKQLQMKIFITESTETSIRYRKRLTMEEISDWRRFRTFLEEQPMEEIIPIKIPELRIKVKGKRIIPENEPPTGLMRTIYDNLVRCKIKGMDPFTECCDRSVFASLEPQIKYVCTWHMFVQMFVKVLILFLLPGAYYIRIYIYYQYEADEIHFRSKTAKYFGLNEKFNFYRSNLIQYLSPTHGLFVTAYVMYFFSGLFVGFTEELIRDKIKSIVRGALQDMSNVQRTSVLQVLLSILLWPFRKCGLLAFIFAAFYAATVAPFLALIFAVYCVPTIYLSYRIFYHTRQKISYTENVEKPVKPISKTKKRVKNAKRKMINIDTAVHLRAAAQSEADEKLLPCTWGTGPFYTARRMLVQLIVAFFLLVCLYSMVVLFVETIGLVVEVLIFTMMGIIVNAGSTLRYVSMALLVFVYMHDCYNNVYESYLSFNKTVIEDVMDRVEDLKIVASLPSSMQENAGFTVKPVETLNEIPTVISFEKKDPAWRIGHLLLFLDSCDTPRIPLNFFKKLCDIRIHGAPGPVYINLLRATGKFLIIVVFLFFVMIVVMAFGNVHEMSSTNQTLATLAGGFVPMLLKNILPRKSKALNLKTLGFKGQIDEIIADFKQNWPLSDFICDRDLGEEESDDKKSLSGELNEDGSPSKKGSDISGEGKDSDDNGKPDKTGDNDENKDEKKEEKKKEEEKKDSMDILNTYIKGRDRRGSNLDLNKLNDNQKVNGLPVGMETAKLLPRHSLLGDNYVDLFIDLSVADTSVPWNIFGSQESVASATMLPPSEMYNDNYGNCEDQFQIPEIKIDLA